MWKREIYEARRERGRLVWHLPVCKAGLGFIFVLHVLFQTISGVHSANPTRPPSFLEGPVPLSTLKEGSLLFSFKMC